MSLRSFVCKSGVVLGTVGMMLSANVALAQSSPLTNAPATTPTPARTTSASGRHCTYACQLGTETRVPQQRDTCSTNTDCLTACQAKCALPNQNGFDRAATCVITGTQAPSCVGSSSVGAPYDPFAGRSVPEIIGQMITFLLGLVGALFLVMFIYGGITWMLAQGDPKRVDSAKKILTNAAIGMAMIMLSYGILSALLGYLTVLDVNPDASTGGQEEAGFVNP